MASSKDEYIIALAASAGAMLVSGDGHLLELADRAPREFAEMRDVL